MAIEKTFNSRLKLRYDSHDNWTTNDPVLYSGEVALATVSVKQEGTVNFVPSVLIKVGDGTHKYSELDFAYAKAADVLDACKTESGLTAFINTVIANAGIATDEALSTLSGRVTTAEGEIDTLQSEMDAVEAKAAANETAITTLNGLVGDKAVATQIQDAIAALDLANTYEVKGEAAKVQTALDTYKTSNDAAVLENKNAAAANTSAIAAMKDGTTIDSFADVESALAGKETAGAAAQALADAKTYADGLAGNYDAKGSATQALTDAKAYADGLAGNYDAAGSAADALADAKEYVDGEIAEWVGDKNVGTQISEAITGLDLANTYAAKEHKHVKADITDFAHTHEISEVNGLQDALDGKQAVGDYATKAEAQGYADAKDTAIQAAQDAADQAQEEVDALETYVGVIPEGYTETNVIAYINKKAQETLETASGGSSESAASVLAALNTYKAENDPKVTANTEAIEALEGLVGENSVASQISAVTNPIDERVKAIEDDYLVEADKTALQNQITANANAIELLTNGVSADEVDGVNDLIQYVKDHGTEVTGIKADIKANADAIDAIEADYLKAADKTALQEQITANDGEIAALQTAVDAKAAQADLEALSGRVTTVEGKVTTLEGEMDTAQADIAALEGLVGENSVASQIAAVTNPMDERIEALEAVDHEHSNKTVLDGISAEQVSAWDSAVQTVTAGTGLTATKSGTEVTIGFDDSVVWVFDCGDSTNV